uniref:Uncharacterized protein n=1 Tax=Brugia malayi TaxID=6279 RepID=A8QCQ2_BRUMA
MITEKLAKGERFCYVFRWIDDLLETDEQAARSCNGDVESYLEIMETQTSDTAYEKRTTTSKSAFIACCISECTACLNNRKADEFIHGLSSSSLIAEPESSSPPSAPESPMLRMANTEMKESGYKTAENGEDMEMIKNTVTANDTFEYGQLGTQSLFNFAIQCGEASMETEPCSSASSVFSESKVKKHIEKWVPVKWMPKIAVNREIYVEHTMANFLSELRLTKNDILIQPCSFLYPDHLTQQLGLNQHIHCMNMDFLADVITRYSIRDLTRWRPCLLSHPRLPENETTHAQFGETLNATSAALGRFVQSISLNDSDETVQQLLTFCLDFEAGLISHSSESASAKF